VGFQIQLCLFENLDLHIDAVTTIVEGSSFDIASEISVSIRKTLENAEEQMSRMFDDDSIKDDPQRWMDFGFFIQNCREYLGHVDIGLPLDLLNMAEDVARRLQNLGMIFEGKGVAIAVRVGKVLAVWHNLQQQLSMKPDALARVASDYVSHLDGAASKNSPNGGADQGVARTAKRRRGCRREKPD